MRPRNFPSAAKTWIQEVPTSNVSRRDGGDLARRNSPRPAAFPAEVQQLLARRVGLHNAVVTRVHNMNIVTAIHRGSIRAAQASGRSILEQARPLGSPAAAWARTPPPVRPHQPPRLAGRADQHGKLRQRDGDPTAAHPNGRTSSARHHHVRWTRITLASLVGPAGNGQTDTMASRRVSMANVA
jgi:hypothetical protein